MQRLLVPLRCTFLPHIALLVTLSLVVASAFAAPPPPPTYRDTRPSTWAGIDALHRSLPHQPLASSLIPNRTVGIFYFLWLEAKWPGPWDNTVLLEAAGGDRHKVKYGPLTAYHWGHPQLGYYRNDDAWVKRKHASMLADAGVDYVCFDVTNGITYDEVWGQLLDVYADARAHGSRTPQITFLFWTQVPALVQHLYDVLYSKGLHEDLWFKCQLHHTHTPQHRTIMHLTLTLPFHALPFSGEGKPLLMANTTGVNATLLPFFTWRESWAWTHGQQWFGDGQDKWPWADFYPQGHGWHTSPQAPEQMPVMVGGWATANVGRSCVAGPNTEPPLNATNPAIGHYFRQQFSWALNRTCSDDSFVCSSPEVPSAVPSVLFVTGWNEWIAGRYLCDGTQFFLGEICPKGDSFFVDEYSEEFSRDIEPMQGGHGDNYYMQLMAYVRYFKGVEATPKPTPERNVSIDCQFSDWQGVQPRYEDDVGDVWTRNATGFGDTGLHYSDYSPLDDLCDTAATVSATSAFFYLATCTGTWSSGGNGTLLYIGLGGTTGWGGFDLRVVVEERTLYRHTGNWTAFEWEKVGGVDVCVGKAGELEVGVSAAVLRGLGMMGKAGSRFVWKWWNGVGEVRDPVDFVTMGDAAPNARFSYVYDSTGRQQRQRQRTRPRANVEVTVAVD